MDWMNWVAWFGFGFGMGGTVFLIAAVVILLGIYRDMRDRAKG